MIDLCCKMVERRNLLVRTQSLGLMLYPRKGNGKENISVATAITMVGQAIKSMIARRKVVERQVKL